MGVGNCGSAERKRQAKKKNLRTKVSANFVSEVEGEELLRLGLHGDGLLLLPGLLGPHGAG